MPRIGIHGKVQTPSRYLDAIPILEWIVDSIENAINGELDSTNLAAGGVATANIADGAVTGAKVAAATLTSSNMADGVGQTTSTTYVGDGATANRVIALGFTPRYVLVMRTDATFITFESIAVGATTYFWSRDATGAQAASAVDFQGIVATGVKLGTSATGTSNANGVTYAVAAWR